MNELCRILALSGQNGNKSNKLTAAFKGINEDHHTLVQCITPNNVLIFLYKVFTLASTVSQDTSFRFEISNSKSC